MSVDRTLYVMYGWKSDTMDKHCPKDEDGDPDYGNKLMVGYWNEDENGNIDFVKSPSLIFVEDGMCGRYEYFGIPIFVGDVDYEEPEIHLDSVDTKFLSEKLEELIIKDANYLIYNDIYDICGLFDGKLPQLHIFIHAH